MRRVVITGLGVISPIGNDVNALWNSIGEGVCGIAPITHFDTSDYKVKLAAEVKDLDMEVYFSKRDLKFNDRFTQFARIASKQAMQDAGFDKEISDADRFGCIIGSGIGGIESIELASHTLSERGASRVSPFFIPMALANLAAGQVAIDWGLKGATSCVVTACAAGSNAIGEAFHRIRDGYEDVMLAGGSEAAITPLAIAGFQSMRALHTGDDAKRASIPFDKQRSGFVMGEGAGILILEELEHAKARNAKIYGEIVGYGSSCDAHHITAPLDDGSGGAKAMVQALQDACIKAEDIDYTPGENGTGYDDIDGTFTVPTDFKFYVYEGNVYKDYEAIFNQFVWTQQKSLDGNKDGTPIYSYSDFTATNIASKSIKVTDFFNHLLAEFSDPLGYLDYLKRKYDTNNNGIYDENDKVYSANKTFTTDDAIDTYTTANVAAINEVVLPYEGGVCYYPYWIRHASNNIPTEMSVMEFAIVRNNIYDMTVTGISGLGLSGAEKPDPGKDDEDEKYYFNVEIYVKNWVVRSNSGILNPSHGNLCRDIRA